MADHVAPAPLVSEAVFERAAIYVMAEGIVNFFFSTGLAADAACSVALAGPLPGGGGSARGRGS
jgi:hypothetical protein